MEGEKIKNADKVVIIFNDDEEIYRHTSTSKNVITDFVKVLNGKDEKRKCAVMGEMAFYRDDSLVYEGGFSISRNGCQYFMHNDKAWKLTYNTGMYLSETLADLKRKK